jgi:hypothetical protein
VVLQSGIDDGGARPSPAAVANAFGSTYWWVLGVAVVALVPTIILTMVERGARTRRAQALPDVAVEAAERQLEPAA